MSLVSGQYAIQITAQQVKSATFDVGDRFRRPLGQSLDPEYLRFRPQGGPSRPVAYSSDVPSNCGRNNAHRRARGLALVVEWCNGRAGPLSCHCAGVGMNGCS